MTTKLYSTDVQLWATIYVKAKSPREAGEIIKRLKGEGLELSSRDQQVAHVPDVYISGKRFSDPALPAISLSPAMTFGEAAPGALIDHSTED